MLWTRRQRKLVTVVVVLAALVTAAPWALGRILWHRELQPVLRGQRLATSLGCFHCHDPDGDEIANPGSRWGTVPRFGAGNVRMYAEDRAEVEEFIRFGAPRAWLDDPSGRARLDSQLIRMPAYDGRIDERAVDDLVAYVSEIEGLVRPGDETAMAGRRLAREHGCLACHGVEGAGGLPNPGALGGFIPGFRGRNFTDLVRDRDEFRQWVLDGTSTRLEKNPVVRWFWRRQRIAMPAYRDVLSDDDVDALWAWVTALRDADRAR